MPARAACPREPYLLPQAEPTPAFKSSRSLLFQPSRQTLLNHLAFFPSFAPILRWISSVRAQALQPRPRPIRVVPAWVSFGITTYLGLRSPTGPPVWHGYKYDSSDSTGSSKPDCLSVSSGFVTGQYVLGAPSGHRRPYYVPTEAHVARVRKRASYWVEVEVRARASWRATRSDRGEP
ncbi:hypothetical protein E5676_scaffold306G001200 [Cucumis melo var. makuwa]|uniref:NBS-LRR type resistance protein n=1 Tax=Cucumis melo var. makuwa TaxID=1194695 RepID=A0A5A7TFE7_CUCMM|nr:hypothetical protein E6C27_scaffold67G003350 [Cucumis melo var. makuwa]TYK17855.1 hypothetical protein E5676_scaffold306G001200 [Cucumis melo var. makuwa]